MKNCDENHASEDNGCDTSARNSLNNVPITLSTLEMRYRRNAAELYHAIKAIDSVADLGDGVVQLMCMFGAAPYLKCNECPTPPNQEFLVPYGAEDDIPLIPMKCKNVNSNSVDSFEFICIRRNGDRIECICSQCAEHCYCTHCSYQGFGHDTYPCVSCEIIICDGCATRSNIHCGPLCVDCKAEW